MVGGDARTALVVSVALTDRDVIAHGDDLPGRGRGEAGASGGEPSDEQEKERKTMLQGRTG